MNVTETLEDNIDCNEITNNGLYLILVGYLLPLISPKIRSYCLEGLTFFRNAGRVAGDLVSLTEFGFEKIQDLSDNKEMIRFIQKMCDTKKLNILPGQIAELAWNFSGDTDNDNGENKQETWKKLLSELNKLEELNKMDNANNVLNKP